VLSVTILDAIFADFPANSTSAVVKPPFNSGVAVAVPIAVSVGMLLGIFVTVLITVSIIIVRHRRYFNRFFDYLHYFY